MKAALNVLLPILLLAVSCETIGRFTRTGYTQERFDAAREAKILQIRRDYAKKLRKKISGGFKEEADFSFYLSEEALNKIAARYMDKRGWIDEETSYKILDAKIDLLYGCAIASVAAVAENRSKDVQVRLTLDCLVGFEIEGESLVLRLEPFNVLPKVKTSGALYAAKGLIERIIKTDLTNLGENMPKLEIPLRMKSDFSAPESKISVNGKVNLRILSPKLYFSYELAIRDVLFFDDYAYLALDLTNIETR